MPFCKIFGQDSDFLPQLFATEKEVFGAEDPPKGTCNIADGPAEPFFFKAPLMTSSSIGLKKQWGTDLMGPSKIPALMMALIVYVTLLSN